MVKTFKSTEPQNLLGGGGVKSQQLNAICVSSAHYSSLHFLISHLELKAINVATFLKITPRLSALYIYPSCVYISSTLEDIFYMSHGDQRFFPFKSS